MQRSTITEKQRAAALLLAAGQHQHKEIARMIGVHRNSLLNWSKDKRVRALVAEFQQNIQHKLEDMAIESTYRTNSPLLIKAVEKLEVMLESKSQTKQLAVIKLLLEYGALPGVMHEKQVASQGERPSTIRLEPELRSRLRVTQS